MKAKGVQGRRYKAINGPSAEILAAKEANSFDALVTDPPAWVEFMGKDWDRADLEGFKAVMREVYRVLKPGAHGLVWALPRTSYLTAYILAEVGFEVRDMITHLFGTGFPKSLNIGKELDRLAGATRQVVGVNKYAGRRASANSGNTYGQVAGNTYGSNNTAPDTAPATDLAAEWEGWGTGLKPACEVWWLIRKPIERGLTVAENVARWGTGAINIGASRVPIADAERTTIDNRSGTSNRNYEGYGNIGAYPEGRVYKSDPEGRWPANLVLSHSPACGQECDPSCPIAELDRQSGTTSSTQAIRSMPNTVIGNGNTHGRQISSYARMGGFDDQGGASRFFNTFDADLDRLITFSYKSKPGRKERDRGCEALPPKTAGQATDRQDGSDGLNSPRAGAGRTGGARNHHPTVKAVGLMEWLCTMITPSGGTILDPYMGSGSTGVAALKLKDQDYRFYGIERDTVEGYFRIAAARLAQAEAEYTSE